MKDYEQVNNGIPMENGANGDANHEEEDEYMRIRRGVSYGKFENLIEMLIKLLFPILHIL